MPLRHLRSHGRRAVLLRLLFGVLLALLIALWSSAPALRPDASARELARPLWLLGEKVRGAASSLFSAVASKRSLAEENRALREALHAAESAVIERDLLAEENRLLKESLGRADSTGLVLAAVLARPSVSPYDTLVLDAGEEEGILGGSLVLAEGNIAIGTVGVVSKRTSVVSLFSTPGRETNVFLGPENVAAVAVGKGGGNFAVRLPRGVEIAEGDAVVLPGVSTRVFAVVEKVVADPADPFHTILFKNPLNFEQIRFVYVVRP